MSHPKRQHWVPRFYLHGFRTEPEASHDNSQIWVFDRKKGEPYITHIRNVCAEGYLYAPRDESGHRSYTVEKRLSELESVVGELWPAITEGITDLDALPIRQALSLFVATLYLRNPQRIEQYESVHRRIVEFFESGPKDLRGKPLCETVFLGRRRIKVDPSGWDSYVRRDTNEHRRTFVAGVMSHAGELARLLVDKRWTIVVADEPTFATSDAPVCLSHPTRSKYGFGTPGITVRLPLSPTRLLMIGDVGLPNGYYDIKDGFGGASNHEVWVNADRYLLSAFDTDVVLAGVMTFVDSLERESAA